MLRHRGIIGWISFLALALLLAEVASRPTDLDDAGVMHYDFEDGGFSTLIPEEYPGPVAWKVKTYKDLDVEAGGKAPRPIEGGGKNFLQLDLSGGVSSGSFFRSPWFYGRNGVNVSFDYYVRSALPEASGIQVFYLEEGSIVQKTLMSLYKASNEFMTTFALIPAGTSSQVQIWVFGNGNVGEERDIVAIDNLRIDLIIDDTATTQPTSTTDAGTTAHETSEPSTPATKDEGTHETTVLGGDTPLPASVSPSETTDEPSTNSQPSVITVFSTETKEDTQPQTKETTESGITNATEQRDTSETHTHTVSDPAKTTSEATVDSSPKSTSDAIITETEDPNTSENVATETPTKKSTNEESRTGTEDHDFTVTQAAFTTTQEGATSTEHHTETRSETQSETQTSTEKIQTTETARDPSHSTETEKTDAQTDMSSSITTVLMSTEEKTTGSSEVNGFTDTSRATEKVTYSTDLQSTVATEVTEIPTGGITSPSVTTETEMTSAGTKGSMGPLTTEEQKQRSSTEGAEESSAPDTTSNGEGAPSSEKETTGGDWATDPTVFSAGTSDVETETPPQESSTTVATKVTVGKETTGGDWTTDPTVFSAGTSDVETETPPQESSTTVATKVTVGKETTGGDWTTDPTVFSAGTSDVETETPSQESSTTVATKVTVGKETSAVPTEVNTDGSTEVPRSTSDQGTTGSCADGGGSTNPSSNGSIQLNFYTVVRVNYPNGEEEVLVFHNQNENSALPADSDISKQLIKKFLIVLKRSHSLRKSW